MFLNRGFGILAIFSLSGVLQGCTTMAVGQPFQASVPPSDGKAVIYVFRPDQPYAELTAPDLTVDGLKVGVIQNAGYLMINVTPGQHTVAIPYNYWNWAETCDPAVIQAKAGDIYFVEVEFSKLGYFTVGTTTSYHCALKEDTPDYALPRISQTRLSQR